MSWINEHQNDWRKALLVAMLVAFLGPWTFERLYVPAEYACSAPNFRLEGDFCGAPISGILIMAWIGSGFISIIFGLLTEGSDLFDRIREILISLLLLFTLLPIFSTLLLTLRGDHPRRQVFTIIAWVLAIVGSLYLNLSSNQEHFWRVWGIWLYLGLAAGALIVEIIVILRKKVSSQ